MADSYLCFSSADSAFHPVFLMPRRLKRRFTFCFRLNHLDDILRKRSSVRTLPRGKSSAASTEFAAGDQRVKIFRSPHFPLVSGIGPLACASKEAGKRM